MPPTPVKARMTNPLHILVVDDDKGVRSMLRRYLTEEGFKVSLAADGGEMRAAFASGQIDLVLLDLVMPGEDGLSLTRHIRQCSATPVIMLTGKGDIIDKVAGLEAGADDYIAKPFHLREVLARIRTVLRRAPATPEAPAKSVPTAPNAAGPGTGDIVTFDGWELDFARRELRPCGGEPIAITTGEFELLRALVTNPNRVLDRDTLMNLTKGRDWAAYDRTIDARIVRLRKRMGDNPKSPRLIKTVRGVGYMFAGSIARPAPGS